VNYLADLRPDLKWLASGFILMLCSGFGQTFYVAIFAGQFRSEFALTNGEFGSLYTLGTLVSAAALTVVGHTADRFPIRWLGALVLGGLAMAAVATGTAASPLMLGVAIFGLRFFGQGMSTHAAMTAMGRWFDRRRGRAVSIAGLGLPAAEALLPPVAVAGIALIGWRETWLWSAGALVAIAVPLFVLLLRHERHPEFGPTARHTGQAGEHRHHWTRREVLGSPLFFALLPVVLAPPFIVTAIFFNQVTLVELRGWQLAWFAAWFPLLAVMHVFASLVTGWLIDRYSAHRTLVIYLLPLGAGSLLLGLVAHPLAVPAAVALIGFAIGCSAATHGALWPELYGTLHLGAIRSMTAAGVVLASAVAPGLVGLLLDAGVSLQFQLNTMFAYCVAAALWATLIQPRLVQQVRGSLRS
jgi:MFS family permease